MDDSSVVTTLHGYINFYIPGSRETHFNSNKSVNVSGVNPSKLL